MNTNRITFKPTHWEVYKEKLLLGIITYWQKDDYYMYNGKKYKTLEDVKTYINGL